MVSYPGIVNTIFVVSIKKTDSQDVEETLSRYQCRTNIYLHLVSFHQDQLAESAKPNLILHR